MHFSTLITGKIQPSQVDLITLTPERTQTKFTDRDIQPCIASKNPIPPGASGEFYTFLSDDMQVSLCEGFFTWKSSGCLKREIFTFQG